MPPLLALLALSLWARLSHAEVNCESMPGAWQGCFGSNCVDTLTVAWRPEGGAGAFWVNTSGSTHEPWSYAECSLAPTNLSATCYFPEVKVWLGGPATYGCRVLDWNNTSTFKKDVSGDITKVHLLWASHLDVGFTDLINNVHNSYITSHFPRALALVDQMRNQTSGDRFRYLTHPWLLSLFFNCPSNFTLAGVTLLCPAPPLVAAMRAALARGDLYYHAAPFNVEWEAVAYPHMGAPFFALARNLSTALGLPMPRTASSRDVPGVTRGVLPLLNAAGITRLSEGVNGLTVPPAMASPAVWRDAASGAQVLYVQHSGGYGGAGRRGGKGSGSSGSGSASSGSAAAGAALRHEVRVPLGPLRDGTCTVAYGWDQALCFDWRGEGRGPPDSLAEVESDYRAFRAQFPKAAVVASSFEEYFDALEGIVDTLPIVTSENGDSWINGVAGDPQKVALYRTAARALGECAASPETAAAAAAPCDLSDPRIADFARFLLKTPEHTWGLPGLDDRYTWANPDFHAAVGTEADFVLHGASYQEQRNVTAVYALGALGDHPLAGVIAQRWAEAQPRPPPFPLPPSYAPLPRSAWGGAFTTGAACQWGWGWGWGERGACL